MVWALTAFAARERREFLGEQNGYGLFQFKDFSKGEAVNNKGRELRRLMRETVETPKDVHVPRTQPQANSQHSPETKWPSDYFTSPHLRGGDEKASHQQIPEDVAMPLPDETDVKDLAQVPRVRETFIIDIADETKNDDGVDFQNFFEEENIEYDWEMSQQFADGIKQYGMGEWSTQYLKYLKRIKDLQSSLIEKRTRQKIKDGKNKLIWTAHCLAAASTFVGAITGNPAGYVCVCPIYFLYLCEAACLEEYMMSGMGVQQVQLASSDCRHSDFFKQHYSDSIAQLLRCYEMREKAILEGAQWGEDEKQRYLAKEIAEFLNDPAEDDLKVAREEIFAPPPE